MSETQVNSQVGCQVSNQVNGKVVFGMYIYSKENKAYSYNPIMLGYYTQEFIESLKRTDTQLLLKTTDSSDNEIRPYKIIADHRYCISDVPFISYAVIPDSFTLSDDLKPKFNAAESISNYIDAIAKRITKLEDEWDTCISKLSSKELTDILTNCSELNLLVSRLKESKGTYYDAAHDCFDPFVPYKTFIDNFFNKCNFYDIIPLLEKRLTLLKNVISQ